MARPAIQSVLEIDQIDIGPAKNCDIHSLSYEQLSSDSTKCLCCVDDNILVRRIGKTFSYLHATFVARILVQISSLPHPKGFP